MATHPLEGSRAREAPPPADRPKLLPKTAALSFTLGLIALRVCWLPGVNCLLALGALTLGVIALTQILKGRGRVTGVDEALTGVVLGTIVLGLSMFFITAIVAAYR